MKKSWLLFFVLICAALSVLSASAAPRDRYYDQLGNKHWCNSDSYGCWVTGENGEHEYIMFWSESARDAIMGPGSNAPIGTDPGTSELPLAAPKSSSDTGWTCDQLKDYCDNVYAPQNSLGVTCEKGWDCSVDCDEMKCIGCTCPA